MQISCTHIRRKALALAKNIDVIKAQTFKTSCKWCFNFLKRNNLFFRSKTSVGQTLPTDWELKRASFLDYYLKQSAGIDLAHIENMDEVHVCFDIPGNFAINEKDASVVKIATS